MTDNKKKITKKASKKKRSNKAPGTTAKKKSGEPVRDKDSDQICEEFGVSRQTLFNYRRQGAPHSRNCGQNRNKVMFNSGELATWMIQNGKTARAGYSAASNNPDEVDGESKAKWDLRKVRAQARQYELQLEQQRGELLDRSEVEAAWARTASKIRQALAGVPARVVGKMGCPDPEFAQQVLQDEIESALTEACQENLSEEEADDGEEESES